MAPVMQISDTFFRGVSLPILIEANEDFAYRAKIIWMRCCHAFSIKN